MLQKVGLKSLFLNSLKQGHDEVLQARHHPRRVAAMSKSQWSSLMLSSLVGKLLDICVRIDDIISS